MRSLTPFTLRRNALKRSVPVSVAYAGGTLPAHCQRSGGRDLLHTDVHGLAADYGHELRAFGRSEEHTSELQSLMRISYAVFCLKKKKYIISRVEPQLTV